MRSPVEPGGDPLPRLLALLEAEPLAELTVLDVGTGEGRLALALAPRCRAVVGVDRDARAIDEARRAARAAGIANARFLVGDVDVEEYLPFRPEMVVARLCMSDAIVERAGRALGPGRVLGFVCFHTDQWKETARPSRFAYGEVGMRRVLRRAGFAVEHLEVEREVQQFESADEARQAVAGLEERWRADGRWERYLRFLREGGRTLTRAHLLVRARKA